MVDHIGYRIDSGHFKLGSKIHIENFYYAKRLFQNSYYATRFSYLLALDILELRLIDSLPNLSIIGYGLYSELMVNRLKSILVSRYPEKPINFNLISDSENMKLLNSSKLHPNILIVIPIATTFSTSVKIEDYIRAQLGDSTYFVQPFFNILVVGDGDFESKTRLEEFKKKKKSKVKKDILARFNWEDIYPESKEIVIKTFPYPISEKRRQKYYICQPSAWHSVEECKLCFPDNYEDEQILIDTDPVSVTPNLIFELPSQDARDLKLSERQVILNHHSLFYGHSGTSPNCFVYRIIREQFVNDNRPAIRDWLLDLKRNPRFGNKKVILISPGHYTNSSFLDFVNEVVFDNLAMVIHYKPDEDFINNFITFYKPDFGRSNTIVYVDDVLASGRVFRALNNFVLQIKADKQEEFSASGVDSIITLIDRSDHFTKKEILRDLASADGCFAFKKMLVAPLYISHIGCPLCLRYKQLDALIESSMLDSLKLYMEEKRNKLRPRDKLARPVTTLEFDPFLENLAPIPRQAPDNLNEAIHKFKIRKRIRRPDKNLLKLLVTHELNYLFADESWRSQIYNHSQQDTVVLIQDILSALSQSMSLKAFFLGSDDDQDRYTREALLKTALIKVLTGSPFIYYKSLREMSFSWIKAELSSMVNGNPVKEAFVFTNIRKLKLLLRRSVILKSNFIISKDLFLYLKSVFDGGSTRALRMIGLLETNVENYEYLYKQKIIDPDFCEQVIYNNQYKLKRIREFNLFILSLVKELIQDSEAKSIHLEKTLNDLVFTSEYEHLKNDMVLFQQSDFFYLWRLLKLENTGTLKQFLQFHIQQSAKNLQYIAFFDSALNRNRAVNSLRRQYFEGTTDYKVDPLKKFLNEPGDNGHAPYTEAFLNTLLLIDFLRFSKPESNQENSLEGKLAAIQEMVLNILGLDPQDSQAVISIEYSSSLDYRSTNSIYSQCGPTAYTHNLSVNGIIFEMLNGISMVRGGFPQTFIELERTKGEQFKGVREKYFRSKGSPVYENSPKDELDLSEALLIDAAGDFLTRDHSHFLFYRLASLDNLEGRPIEDKGQAVLSISSGKKGLHAPERIRLLLLAKEYLIRFLETHFKNDSFVEMLENKAKVETMTTLQHGLKRYIDTLKERIVNSGLSEQEKDDFSLVTIILNNQLSNHTNYYSNNWDQEIITWNAKEIEDFINQLLRVILVDNLIGNPISATQLESAIEISGEQFRFNYFMIYQILPELVINIKKANHLLTSTEKLKIRWTITQEGISVSNSMDEVTAAYWEFGLYRYKKGGGIHMCDKLLGKENLPGIKFRYDKDKKRYTAFFHLKPAI